MTSKYHGFFSRPEALLASTAHDVAHAIGHRIAIRAASAKVNGERFVLSLDDRDNLRKRVAIRRALRDASSALRGFPRIAVMRDHLVEENPDWIHSR